jgi:hypothetical protein
VAATAGGGIDFTVSPDYRSRLSLKKIHYFSFDLFLGFGAGLKSVSPGTSWVEDIPGRFLLPMSSGAWIMVAKSVHHNIPERLESFDEQ